VPADYYNLVNTGAAAAAAAGHVAVEKYLAAEGLPYSVFQPLYIYGPHTAKDCEQWFVDRIIRWGTGSCCCSSKV
jgi:hypothetical protein